MKIDLIKIGVCFKMKIKESITFFNIILLFLLLEVISKTLL